MPCLDTPAKWNLAVSLYLKELQFVQKEYNEKKYNPPLLRDLPPITGKIAWSRQLYFRISQPVKVFQKQVQLMKQPETKKSIRFFNKLAQVSLHIRQLFLFRKKTLLT